MTGKADRRAHINEIEGRITELPERRLGNAPTSPGREDTALIYALSSDRAAALVTSAHYFDVVRDKKLYLYTATIDGYEIGRITYVVAARRISLLAVVVVPSFRRQGTATEFIARVLDDIRADGNTITVECSVIAAFLCHYPRYNDLVNDRYPGSAIDVRPEGA